MESPPVAEAQYVSQNSRKRVLSGQSEVFMDPEVIEIPPPENFQTPRGRKHKQVIDVDEYEDSADIIILDEIVKTGKKGKAIKNDSDGSSSYQSKVSPKNSVSGSQSIINVDFYGDQHVDFDNDFMDVEDYALLQAYFESANIPAGVEVPLPCLQGPALRKEKTVISKSVSLKPASGSSSSLQKDVGFLGRLAEVYHSSASLNPQSAHDENSAASKGVEGSASNLPFYDNSSNLPWHWGKSKSNGKLVASGISTNYDFDFVNQFDPMILPEEDQPPSWYYGSPALVHNPVGTSNLSYSGIPALNYPAPIGSFMPWSQESWKPQLISTSANYHTHPSFYDPSDAVLIPPEERPDPPSGQDSDANKTMVNGDDALSKFKLFKKFDAVEDHSDHHYASKVNSTKQPSNKWMKRIHEEWKILENDLPDTIFVRVYESRMDLLRAVIIGAEGTPYHDGLFFFDVFFPSGYPNIPPLVHYHSGGLRLNPNLYNCGKVCLSLLNTWNGQKNERWIPSVSTMLQVLVSIQALILNQKPYFNEPGCANMIGTPHGESGSHAYNENTFILSLKTMLYTVRRPPKHFKDFVMGHFYSHAHDILNACKAYMGGAQVGSLVKGGVQLVHVGKTSSQHFKNSLAGYIDVLAKEFTQIGVEDCEKFLTQTKGMMPANRRSLS